MKVKISFVAPGCCYPPWPSPNVMRFEQVEQMIAVRAYLSIPMDAPMKAHRDAVKALTDDQRATLLGDVAGYQARLKAAGKLPDVLRSEFEGVSDAA